MRRLLPWPPRQTASCSGCGRVITERKRRPCPGCGGLARTFSLAMTDAVKAELSIDT